MEMNPWSLVVRRRENELRGPRPTPLRIKNELSGKIKVSSSVSVFHVATSNFASLVAQFTGIDSDNQTSLPGFTEVASGTHTHFPHSRIPVTHSAAHQPLSPNTSSDDEDVEGKVASAKGKPALLEEEVLSASTEFPEVIDDCHGIFSQPSKPGSDSSSQPKKKDKAINKNEFLQDYSNILLEFIKELPERFRYDLSYRHLISIWERVEPEHILRESLDCLAYCNLFPEGYEIEGDEIIQLWMAAGFIQQEPMELFACAYLRIIHQLGVGFISLTGQDYNSAETWYKLNDPTPWLSTGTLNDHFHALFKDQPLNLDSVSCFTETRTLLLLKGHGSSHIDRVPYGFFMSLNFLQALDLSGTRLLELPSSVGGAKCLRYLNLSETLIQRLPETICCLPDLQTLKLRNCSRLVALPKAMSRVTSLRHLDLGTLCDLCSMPPRLGALTRLCTLSNFVVSREFGCCLGELKKLNALTGRVCLSSLENVGSVEEAKRAQLQYKLNITKLQLRWTDSLERENVEDDDDDDCEEEVIQHLEPPKELQDLEILCYAGSKFPTWISLPWFHKLSSITLFKCENCQFLPSLGQLPSLENLTLVELVQVKIIDLKFCIESTTTSEDSTVAFPKLKRFEIESMLSLEEWRDMGKLHCFPCLSELVIKDCPQLTNLCRLSNLCCLNYLEINCCGKLPSLPEGGLPTSIRTFVIDDCPLLSLSCNDTMEEEQGWHKMEHTSTLLIYHYIDMNQSLSPRLGASENLGNTFPVQTLQVQFPSHGPSSSGTRTGAGT